MADDGGAAHGVEGLFVHPVEDEPVMAGNGTIGLEVLKDLPDPDAVVIPYGGGGLTAGIASAVKALRPETEGLHGRAGDRRAVRGLVRGRLAAADRLLAVVRRRAGGPVVLAEDVAD